VAQDVAKNQQAKQIELGLEFTKETDLEPTLTATIVVHVVTMDATVMER
jgi:hypothetical protein